MAASHKRPALADDDLRAAKIPKVEPALAAPDNDFSRSVKKKLASSSRTGQACDRCKIRKIRCDPRPEGCSPCAQNRTPCRTTDRITGRATTRGQVEALESENNYLRSHVAELQAQLKEMGVEPRPPSTYNAMSSTYGAWPPSTTATSEWDPPTRRTSTSPLPAYTPASSLEKNRPLPQFKHHSFGDNYLGVSSADSLLSNISGTSLSVFGYEIDITDFVDDKDYDNSFMSYTYVMRVALNHTQIEPVPLPPYQTLKEYCSWFFRSMHPYIMLLDKDTIMKLIWRMEKEPGFTPSPSEKVCVHMVIASLNYQISVRNRQAALMEDSHRHYRYALSHFKDLWLSHTWRDVQALTLIVHHLRNFPKPGAAWIMAATTFQLAIELGYHRSSKAWANHANMDKLEVEIRKRTFWTLHALTTHLCGKLGRPMPINLDDIDVEFPEAMNDCLPEEETDLDSFHKCSFHVGIQVAKFSVPLSQLHRTLYSINASPRAYEENLKRLEAGIQKWKEEIPAQLRDPKTASQDDYIFAVYLEYWYQEYHLHMYHPAMCRSKDPVSISESLDKCLLASKKLLHACNEMRKLRSLDNTWINIVTYVAAIFTTLFGHYQRRDSLTSADMDVLKSDMDQWIDLIGESGQLLGFGDKMKDTVAQVVERSLNNINESIYKRTASQSLAQVELQAPEHSPSSNLYTNGNHQQNYTVGAAAEATTVASTPQAYSIPPSRTASYSYSSGASGPVPSQATSNLDAQSYGTTQDPAINSSHAAVQTHSSNDPYAYTNAQVASSGHHAGYANEVPPADWHQWTRSTMASRQHVASQNDYCTAATLRSLGGRGGSFSNNNQDGTITGDPSIVMQTLASNNWPEMQFVPPSNGYVGQQ